MRIWLAVAVTWGCGSASPPAVVPPPPPPPPQPQPQPVTSGAPSIDSICDHVMTLQADKCANFGTSVNLSRADCTTMFSERPDNPHDVKQQQTIAKCVVDPGGCAAVTQCLAALDDADRGDLRTCADQDSRAVGVPAADFAAHDGRAFAHYGEVVSSKAAPVERCGIPDANRWLAQLACGDGSHPVKSEADAERVRIGNVGPGGRCRSIVDLYRVTCPDAASDIFIDAYVCPQQ